MHSRSHNYFGSPASSLSFKNLFCYYLFIFSIGKGVMMQGEKALKDPAPTTGRGSWAKLIQRPWALEEGTVPPSPGCHPAGASGSGVSPPLLFPLQRGALETGAWKCFPLTKTQGSFQIFIVSANLIVIRLKQGLGGNCLCFWVQNADWTTKRAENGFLSPYLGCVGRKKKSSNFLRKRTLKKPAFFPTPPRVAYSSHRFFSF